MKEINYLKFFKKAFKRNEELLTDSINGRDLAILVKNAKDIKESLEGKVVPTPELVEQLNVNITGLSKI